VSPFAKYVSILLQLNDIDPDGNAAETVEMERLYEAQSDPWGKMDQTERQAARKISAALNELSYGRRKR
jgi:hypothetical protein